MLLACAASPGIGGGVPSWVETTTFPAVKDTYVSRLYPDTAYGTSNTMIVGEVGNFVYTGSTRRDYRPGVQHGFQMGGRGNQKVK